MINRGTVSHSEDEGFTVFKVRGRGKGSARLILRALARLVAGEMKVEVSNGEENAVLACGRRKVLA